MSEMAWSKRLLWKPIISGRPLVHEPSLGFGEDFENYKREAKRSAKQKNRSQSEPNIEEPRGELSSV